MKKTILFIFILLGSFILLNAWQLDVELLYSQVKPNILIIFDTSGSMNAVIYFPTDPTDEDGINGTGYNPGTNYTSGRDFQGGFDELTSTRWVARWISGSTAYEDDDYRGIQEKNGEDEIRVNDGSDFSVGDWIINRSGTAAAKISAINGNWLVLEKRNGTFSDNSGTNAGRLEYRSGYECRPVKLYGCVHPNNMNAHYNYYQDYERYLTWIYLVATEEEREAISWFADHGTFDTSDNTVYVNRYTRIQVARQSLEEIITTFKDDVRMGLFRLNSSNGGRVGEYDDGGTTKYGYIKDMANVSDRTDLINIVQDQNADGSTPIAETLAEVWRYFRGLSSDYNTGVSYVGNSPCDLWCRKNFVILMTDGAPTSDSWFPGGLGSDHDGDSESSETGSGTYLDDIAHYLFRNDAAPSLGNGADEEPLQNIQTYSIGFTTAGGANTLLTDTAANGGGTFYPAHNFNDLFEAFRSILADIYEQSNAFAQFAAPKQSTAAGKLGYVATFIPRNNKALWEGHLHCYLLSQTGEFTVSGNGEIQNPNPNWVTGGDARIGDAGVILKERDDSGTGAIFPVTSTTGDRIIFTYKGGNMEFFTKANTDITQADLTASDAAERDKIIDEIRGTTNVNGYSFPPSDPKRWKLGDIFHFNPLVIGIPHKWKGALDPSYMDFYDYYSADPLGSYPSNTARKEVIYVGTNDGMLHCFDVATGQEIWGFVPFEVLPNLKNIANNIGYTFFVDGKATYQDIKVGTAGDYTDWHTVLVFGLGMGGKSYYALDVTDPYNPSMLWEIGNDGVLGYTMESPAFGRVNHSSGTFDIVVLSGGYDGNGDIASSNAEGKAIYIVKASDGTTVKKYVYGGTASNSSTLWEGGFDYCMSAGPLVIDRENDGFADFLYQGDIGGQLWRIDLRASNSANWQPQRIFCSEGTITGGSSDQPIYITPNVGFDDIYNLWVFLGTGKRPTPNDQTSTGQFFAFKDDGSYHLPSTDLEDIKADIINSMKLDTDGDGFPDEQETNAGTSINDPDDYPNEDPWTQKKLDPAKDGFYFEFLNGTGEKFFEPTPIYIGHYVFFNTYLPSPAVGGDTCDPKGDMFFYSFKLNTNLDNESSLSLITVEKGRILGSGVVSGGDFIVYEGEGEIGSDKVKDQKHPPTKDFFGSMFWIEKK